MKDHIHEKTMAAMDENFKQSLNRMIARKMAATLEAEGPLTAEELHEKCSAVAKLSMDLMLDHLVFAIQTGVVAMDFVDGQYCYSAVRSAEHNEG